MEPDASQWSPVTGQEVMGTLLRHRKTIFYCEVSQALETAAQ